MINEIRWKQRFQNFDKAFVFLTEGVNKSSYSKLEEAGVIQAFEFTFELAWKTLKDYLELMGITATTPRDAIKQSFKAGYIIDGQAWLEALDNRNQMSHLYDDNVSQAVLMSIKNRYYDLLSKLHTFLSSRLDI